MKRLPRSVRRKSGGLEKDLDVAMNKALDKLVESIVLDEELAAALNSRLTQQPSIASTE